MSDTRFRREHRLVLLAVLLSVFSVSAVAQTTDFDVETFRKHWYPSHEGKSVTTLGLNHAEISSVLASAGMRQQSVLARRVDMGEGAEHGLVIQGNDYNLCGGTGNCSTWFFRKIGAKWAPVKGDWGPDPDVYTSAFAFLPPKRHGLYELVVMTHESSDDAAIEVLWFDGKQYRSNQDYCWHPQENKIVGGPCR